MLCWVQEFPPIEGHIVRIRQFASYVDMFGECDYDMLPVLSPREGKGTEELLQSDAKREQLKWWDWMKFYL